VNDDTIRDQMDLGYVATRPRFSRSRRTWNLNIRNLTAEDVRALDTFAEVTVQRGSLCFYFPNLAPNWSFEVGPSSGDEVVAAWSITEQNAIVVTPGSTAADGLSSLQFAAGAITGSDASQVTAGRSFFPVAGEVYEGVFQVSADITGSGFSVSANLQIALQMSDGSTVTVSPAASNAITASTSGFVWVSQQLTIPAPAAGLTITSAQAQIAVAATAIAGLNLFVDTVGLALTSSAQPYGRMVGSAPIPARVRFAANKIPQFSDLGYGDGVKVYGTTFAIEEV
jgi:hypothetical protein